MNQEEILDIALRDHPDAAALKAAMLSEDFVSALQNLIASSAAERRRRDLVVRYGERRGGMVLQLLQIFDGAYWGTGLELTFEQCALVLGQPAERLAGIYDEMLDEIRPLLASDEDLSGSEPTAVAPIRRKKPKRSPAGRLADRTNLRRGRRRGSL